MSDTACLSLLSILPCELSEPEPEPEPCALSLSLPVSAPEELEFVLFSCFRRRPVDLRARLAVGCSRGGAPLEPDLGC